MGVFGWRGVGLRVAVEQQERGAGACGAQAQIAVGDPVGGQLEVAEEVEHAAVCRGAVAGLWRE